MKVTVMARETFNNIVRSLFERFAQKFQRKVHETSESFMGLQYMNVIHDMWTNSSKDGILGCTVAFVDKNFVLWSVPVLATQNNYSHAAKDVAKQIKDEISKKYNFDIGPLTKFVVSDTTSSAQNVADHFEDVIQKDGDMHVLNLILQYALGMKENTRQHEIVTRGGQFEEGRAEIKKLRRLSAFFGTPQRLSRLKDFVKVLTMTYLAPIMDAETRVAFAMALIKRSFYLYDAYKSYFDQAIKEKAFKAAKVLFGSIDWKLLAEMEGINSYLARLALREAQQGGITASYNLYYRIQGLKSVNKESFLCLEAPPVLAQTKSNEEDLKRRQILIASLTAGGKTCLARVKYQLHDRYLDVSKDTIFASCLDPRTKALTSLCVDRMATKFQVPMNDKKGEPLVDKDGNLLAPYLGPVADYEAAELVLHEEHRAAYRMLRTRSMLPGQEVVVGLAASASDTEHAPAQQGADIVSGTNNEPDNLSTLSDMEDESFECDDSLAEAIPAVRTIVNVNYDSEADAFVKEWMNLFVDWCDVAKAQGRSTSQVDQLKTPSKSQDKAHSGDSTENWDADALYRHINILQWFRTQPMFHEHGRCESMGVLARIYLAQVESGAVQERVFSMAKHIHTVLRTSTDPERQEQQLLLRVNVS
jgi:hypothetical protein